MTARHVAALGAVDRYNYGDLLFPLVLAGAMKRLDLEAEVRAYGIVARDMSGTGAMPTSSYRQLVDAARGGELLSVVVVGGEVIGAEWTTMLTHLGSSAQETAVKAARKLLGRRRANRIAAMLVGGPTAWPWVLSGHELGADVPVIFNAVGGASSWPSLDEAQRAELAAALRAADYVSVRDPVTAAHLSDAGVGDVVVTPDSAVVMSDLWPLDALRQRVRPAVRELPETAPFVAIQANRRVGSTIAGALVEQARTLATELDLALLPLPIGRVAGHDDVVALQPLAALPLAVSIPGDLDVWEIMYLIATSRLFVGTSLHGSITALSFGVPHLALTSRVPKLTAHLAAWSDPRLHRPAEVHELARMAAEAVAVPRSDLELRSAAARAAAWDDLSRVCRAAVGAGGT